MTDKINNNVINELEYLMNPCMYDKWIKKHSNKLAPTDLKKDIKFYKKRIIQLTKDILQEEYEGMPSETLEVSDIDEDVDPNNSLINPSYLHKQNKIEDYIDLKKISNVPNNETYLPERKELKLKDPQLKKKGIRKKRGKKKKKNIN